MSGGALSTVVDTGGGVAPWKREVRRALPRLLPEGQGAAERSRRVTHGTTELDGVPVIAAALGGLILTCSALRARYHGRILALEREVVRLSQVAERDPLTGLGNRRSFDRCFDVEWRRALRHNSHLTLGFVDIDHFKLFNDTYGHPAGDRTLRRVALCLTEALGRAADGVFRVGGEEFALLLPDTDSAGAQLIGDRVCATVRSVALSHERSPSGVLTISFGSCSALVRDGEEIEDLTLSADQALYEAKRAGRGRAVCWSRRTSASGAGPSRLDSAAAPRPDGEGRLPSFGHFLQAQEPFPDR